MLCLHQDPYLERFTTTTIIIIIITTIDNLRNDINITPLCLSRNILHQNPRPILNRSIRRHRGRNHLDPFHGQGILDTVPILNGRQEGARQLEFGEP